MSAEVKVITSNFKAIRGAVTGDALKKAAFAVGHYVEAQAKINVEKTFSGKSTGGTGLAGSIQTVLAESSPTTAWVDVGPTVIYGRIRELGGMIRPVAAKMLSWIAGDGNGEGKQKIVGFRFYDEKNNRMFAEAVQVFPSPYLRPAVDEHMTRIKWLVTFTLNRAIEAAAK